MPRVDIPGVGVVDFPDSMAHADIEKAIAAQQARATPDQGLPPGVVSPEQLGGPRANFIRSMRGVPFLAGAIGAAAGGPLGARLGGGAAAPVASMLTRAAGSTIGAGLAGAGGRVGEGAITGQPATRGQILGAGLSQAALEAPAAALGPIAAGLRAGAGALKGRAAEEAVKRVRTLRAAGNIEQPVKAELAAARARRELAGAEVNRALASKPEAKVTIADLVDDAIRTRPKELPPLTPQAKSKLVRDVRNRVREVAQDRSLGTWQGNQITFSLSEANFLKRQFQQMSRGTYGQLSRGIAPKPDLDLSLGNAFQRSIEKHAPEVAKLNKTAQEAILDVQDLSRMARSERRAVTKGLRAQQEEARAAAAAQLPQTGRLTFGLHGVGAESPSAATLVGALGKVAGSRPVNLLARLGPRGAALLAQLMQPVEAPMEQPPNEDLQRRLELLGGLQ